MNNISFYRKYRPSNFDDVVGQKRIVTILNNSINKDMVRHAYIFSGPRGTGKTSLAKLFARKINCVCKDGSCNLCCDNREFADIWEIDAASNNSVNNIRELIEDAMYLPLELKKKIYIIDEVHMLSNSAFNALLKTLEDPPKHIVFILATTELDKVLTTVLSRCVKLEFDFISEVDITSRLEYVCNKENISYDIKALEIISSLSGGGLRDALSLLETVYSNSLDISMSNTIISLNIADSNMCDELFAAMCLKNIESIRLIIYKVMSEGINYIKFTNQYINYLKKQMQSLILEDKRIISKWLLELVQLLDKLCHTRNSSLLFEAQIISISICSELLSCSNDINNNDINNNDINNNDINNNEFHTQISNALSDEEVIKEEFTIIDMLEINDKGASEFKQPTLEKSIISLEDNGIVLYDILSKATKEYKSNISSNYNLVKNAAENDKAFSIAKFFELSQVRAASSFGCVITIDNEMFDLYQKRLDEIKNYMCKEIEDIKKVFIYSDQEWMTKRDEFLNAPGKENTNILDVANNIFGKEFVKKI